MLGFGKCLKLILIYNTHIGIQNSRRSCFGEAIDHGEALSS